jgi:hypothetical protein
MNGKSFSDWSGAFPPVKALHGLAIEMPLGAGRHDKTHAHISNRRLIAFDHNGITFKYKDYRFRTTASVPAESSRAAVIRNSSHTGDITTCNVPATSVGHREGGLLIVL